MQIEKFPADVFFLKPRKKTGRNLLFCTPLAEVDHGLPELLLADAPVVVVVEDPEGGADVVHLVAAGAEDVLPHKDEVGPGHEALPVTVRLAKTMHFCVNCSTTCLLV
jgi:hypothetical protein